MKKLDKKYNILLPVKNEKLKRMGRNSDGGYVIDENISNNCKTLISFGLGNDWSFEKDYIKQNKHPIFFSSCSTAKISVLF